MASGMKSVARSILRSLKTGREFQFIFNFLFYRYTYDVRHCMFSVGNVTEKIRVANFDCTEETVVDLYAGGWSGQRSMWSGQRSMWSGQKRIFSKSEIWKSTFCKFLGKNLQTWSQDSTVHNLPLTEIACKFGLINAQYISSLEQLSDKFMFTFLTIKTRLQMSNV